MTDTTEVPLLRVNRSCFLLAPSLHLTKKNPITDAIIQAPTIQNEIRIFTMSLSGSVVAAIDTSLTKRLRLVNLEFQIPTIIFLIIDIFKKLTKLLLD